MTHTLGPWRFGNTRYGLLTAEVVGNDGARVTAAVWVRRMKAGTKAHETEPWPEGEGNAHLIIAAPDLLDACEMLLQTLRTVSRFADSLDGVPEAVAAIARARG